jgi:SnoaL-like protein
VAGSGPVEHDAVLFANEAFYRAFATRDLAAMEEVWARHCPIACIHPGWAPLQGRPDVMGSWQRILGNPGSPAIACHGARATVFGDSALVVCFESVPGGFLVASNLFVRQGAVWKLVHHQAGPTNGQPEEEPEEGSGRPN